MLEDLISTAELEIASIEELFNRVPRKELFQYPVNALYLRQGEIRENLALFQSLQKKLELTIERTKRRRLRLNFQGREVKSMDTAKLMAGIDAATKTLADQRDAFLSVRSQDYKAGYWTGEEAGLIKAGMHIQSLIIAGILAKA